MRTVSIQCCLASFTLQLTISSSEAAQHSAELFKNAQREFLKYLGTVAPETS